MHPVPTGCAWCGLPLDVEGFDHRACTAVRERGYGCMPLSTYHRKNFDPRAWEEVIRLHVATVENAAAAWALEADLTNDQRAAYIVAARQAAEDLGWRQKMADERPYVERKAIEAMVTEERQLIARHRAPDGSAYQGLV